MKTCFCKDLSLKYPCVLADMIMLTRLNVISQASYYLNERIVHGIYCMGRVICNRNILT